MKYLNNPLSANIVRIQKHMHELQRSFGICSLATLVANTVKTKLISNKGKRMIIIENNDNTKS